MRTITTVAGGGAGDGGPATSAALFLPASVALDGAGNLYIADRSNCRVRKVFAGTPPSVGGIAEQPDVAGLPATAVRSSSHNRLLQFAIAAAGLFCFSAAGWYAARRRRRE